MAGPGDIVLAMQHIIPLELDLSTLRRAIGGGSYVRGAEYARQQAVQKVTWGTRHDQATAIIQIILNFAKD